MAEEGRGTNLPSRLKTVMKESPFFCKVLELILCVVAVGLVVDPFNNRTEANLNHAGIVYVSICGYVMINAIFILCYLLGERQPKKTSIIFSGTGAILCCSAGLVLIYDWHHFQDYKVYLYEKQYSDQMLSSGIFALLAALVFVIDVYLTNKHE